MEAEVIFDYGEFEFILNIAGDLVGRGDGQVVDIAGVAEIELRVLADDFEDLAVEFEAGEVEEIARGGSALGESKGFGLLAFGVGGILAHGGECGEEVHGFIKGVESFVSGISGGEGAKFAKEWFDVASKDAVDAGEAYGGEGVADIHEEELFGVGEMLEGVGDDRAAGNSTMRGVGDADGVEQAVEDTALDFFERAVRFVDIAPFEAAGFGDAVMVVGFAAAKSLMNFG